MFFVLILTESFENIFVKLEECLRGSSFLFPSCSRKIFLRQFFRCLKKFERKLRSLFNNIDKILGYFDSDFSKFLQALFLNQHYELFQRVST